MVSALQQKQYLKMMGIEVYLERNSGEAEEAQAAGAGTPVLQEHDEDWQMLKQAVADCTRCELHRHRKQTVFGVGNIDADLMIIGEAPGAEEDRQGEPFVGRAGKLLNAMLGAMALGREQVFIANILKCRPPDNRDPKAAEVAECEQYLEQQIARIQPRVILALGRIAAQNLLKMETPIGRMRGGTYVYPGTEIPVVVTYHPAYLLRSPREKSKSWQDLQLAMSLLGKGA